jgi:flavorubredoxin
MNLENVLFEGVWDIPEGVSLNSYVIKGDKTAIIDGFAGSEESFKLFGEKLKSGEIDISSVDYLIINHMEPDHSGWLESFRKINANFKVLCSQKAKDLLEVFYGQTERIEVIEKDLELDLGKGHVLNFIEMPNVHWPDTISTFDKGTNTLFSCDMFGSFGKIEEKYYAHELDEKQILYYEKEMTRYYSNVMATFSMAVTKAVEKCKEYPVEIIAPGHGLLWKKHREIYDRYEKLAAYQKGPAKKEITLVWGSMYGMTQQAVMEAEEALKESGVVYHIHQVPKDSWGTVLTSVWNSTGVILAMPTYEYKMFPPMAAALEEMGKKKVLNKKAFRFGSYGWSGGAQKELEEIMERHKMNWDFMEPVEFKGVPGKEDLKKIRSQVLLLVSNL